RLGRGPVDAGAVLDRLAAVVEEALDGAMRLEALRHLGQLLADLLQRLDRNGGLAATQLVLVVGGAQPRPGAVQPVGLVRLVALAGLELLLEASTPVGPYAVDLVLGDQALGDQAIAIELDGRVV